MGGVWSGTWSRSDTKTITENCISISVQDIFGNGHASQHGLFEWERAGGRVCWVSYVIDRREGLPTIMLTTFAEDGTYVKSRVGTLTTPVHFGGQRLWLACQLSTNAGPCGRRVGKLYLPPGAKYFGCRQCYNLTYRSCQEAHQAERGTGTAAWLERGLKALQRNRRS